VLVAAAVPALDAVELGRQLVLGAATWLVLGVLLRSETLLVRVQTLVVVALATCVEYTFSPLLEAYTYRIGTVPLFVPPGHGLVYLAALAFGRSAVAGRYRRPLVAVTVVAGGAWALAGVLGPRHDALGAFWFLCLLGFLRWGPNRLLYVGAFVVVSYLELAGTALGVWAWAPADPVMHVIGQGNPPSGAGSTSTRSSWRRGCYGCGTGRKPEQSTSIRRMRPPSSWSKYPTCSTRNSPSGLRTHSR
jgi:hypothetical protein